MQTGEIVHQLGLDAKNLRERLEAAETENLVLRYKMKVINGLATLHLHSETKKKGLRSIKRLSRLAGEE